MPQPSQNESRSASLAERSESTSPWSGWLAVFVAALALYAATANRGAQWQDSGFHILRAVTGELIHPLGLALAHPLHHWLARVSAAVPLLEPCFAVTLISSLAAATAVANVYGCTWTLTRNRTASLLAAASLALAHTFWQMATLAETYTLVAALLSAECWCIAAYARADRQTYFFGAILLNGLGIANHMLASLTTPLLVVVAFRAVRSKDVRVRGLLVAIGLWLLGSLPYTGLVVTEMIRTGDISATLQSALFGKSFADEVLNTAFSLRMLLVGAAFFALNFPNLLIPVAICGMFRGERLGVPRLARHYLLAALILHVCFAARYSIVDQHTFFLPTYVLLAVFGGIGFVGVLCWSRVRLRRIVLVIAVAAIALTPACYALVPTIARHFNVLDSVARNKPYRNDYVYVFTPWSVVEQSAGTMSRHAVELAGKRGLILVEDPMAEFAIRYRAIRAQVGDNQIVRDGTPEAIVKAVRDGKAVVLVPKDADVPGVDPPIGSWKRAGDLYTLSAEDAAP